MEYIEGLPLSGILKALRARDSKMSLPAIVRVMIEVLHGLHAAHELTSEDGWAAGLVLWECLTGRRLFSGGTEAFRLDLPVGHVYRVLITNSTANGELRQIHHLVNQTSGGKTDEIAVKDGGTMKLGTLRPAAAAGGVKPACDCDDPNDKGGGKDPSGGSCNCSAQCGSGSRCIASKCTGSSSGGKTPSK